MPDPKNPPSSPELAPVSSSDVRTTRRRLLQGGVAAAPVLMTLVSRPVLAQSRGQACQTPSGFVSLNASTAGRAANCTGRSPVGYSSNTTTWPAPYTPTTLFKAVFNTPPFASYAGKTLLDILNLSGTPPYDDVAKLIVAALLNAQAGLTPVLSVQTVKHMWSEFSTTLTFSPSSGASWNHDELVDYLQITQPF